MALTIGELVGIIQFDASGVDQGVNQAETRMRQLGDSLGAEAEQAGQTAGDNLGDGVIEGAEAQLRGGEGQLAATGEQIGESVGEGVENGSEQGSSRAAESIGNALGKVKGLLIGGAIGAALMDGLGEAMDQQQVTGKLQAQLGTTPETAARYGKIAGKMYADGVTEDFATAADAIKSVMQAGLLPPDATNSQIQSISTKVSDLANTFDQDLGGTTAAVSQMIKTGLAKNADEALDILTKGFQSGVNKADDLLDTMNEYGTQFRKLGIDGKTATGILSQGLKGGARDADLVADAIKEFSIRAVDGSKTTADGFKALGLNADDMAKKFGKGGSTASAALDQTMDKLRNFKDPVKQGQIATQLFGTQAEDLGKALYSIDPSKASAAIGKVGGSADKMGKALRDNAGHEVTAFTRNLKQGLVNVLGTYVIPQILKLPEYARQVGDAFKTMRNFVASNQTTFEVIGGVIGTIILPSLVSMAVTATTSAATTVAAWVTQAGAAISTGATYVGVNALIIAGWIKQAVQAGIAAARTVAAWVLMGVQSTIQAAKMAAAWVIAMGPIGWAIAAVVALVALVIANWDKVKSWTITAWNAVSGAVMTAVHWVTDNVKSLWGGLVSWVVGAWNSITSATTGAWNAVKDAVMSVVQWIVNWVVGTYTDFVAGLQAIWDGLKSASEAVWNSIKSSITGVWNAIKSSVTTVVNGIKNFVSGAWTSIKNTTSNLWNNIKLAVYNGIIAAQNKVNSVLNSIKGFFSSAWNSIKNTVSNAISGVVDYVKGLPGKVKNAVSGAASWLYSAGKSIIQGLINGIKNMAGKVVDAVKGVLSSARKYLPFSPAKKGPFAGKGWTLFSGRSVMEAMAKGIMQRKNAVSGAMKTAVAQANRHQLSAPATMPFTTQQAAVQNRFETEAANLRAAGGGFHIENYFESNTGSAKDTATELEWLAKARG